MHYPSLLSTIGLILFGIISRFIPHLPNCTALNAIAFFSAYFSGNLTFSLFTVYTTLLFSDLLLGFHSEMLFVYSSFALVSCMGILCRSVCQQKNSSMPTLKLPLMLAVGSFLFFVASNFGVWFTSALCPKTVMGLITCYFLAIPFLLNQLAGDLIYGTLLFALAHYFYNYHKAPQTI